MTIRIFSLVGLFSMTLLFTTCKKKSSENNCDTGGITIPNTYRFWTALPMYNTTVQVKNESGSLMPANGTYTPVTEIYYIKPTPNWEPDPCTYNANKEAVFGLAINSRYTWKATNGSQSWTGAINVPCEQGQCHNIEIK